MSQVKFKAEVGCEKHRKHYLVVGGYDVPLDYYHFSVYDCDAPEDEDDVIWCNLNYNDAFPKDTNWYRVILQDLAIEPPTGFWEHCNKREGNVLYEWNGKEWIVDRL